MVLMCASVVAACGAAPHGWRTHSEGRLVSFVGPADCVRAPDTTMFIDSYAERWTSPQFSVYARRDMYSSLGVTGRTERIRIGGRSARLVVDDSGKASPWDDGVTKAGLELPRESQVFVTVRCRHRSDLPGAVYLLRTVRLIPRRPKKADPYDYTIVARPPLWRRWSMADIWAGIP